MRDKRDLVVSIVGYVLIVAMAVAVLVAVTTH
jgi:hypothetical protein